MDIEVFIQHWLDTYNHGDLEAALACYTEDVTFEDPIFGETVKGRDKLRAAFATFFHTGVTRLRYLRFTGSEAGGAVEWEWTADWGPNRTFLGFDCSDTQFVTRGISVLTLRDGLICRQLDLWNLRVPLQTLGVLPRPT